jgi:hypothetical protein
MKNIFNLKSLNLTTLAKGFGLNSVDGKEKDTKESYYQEGLRFTNKEKFRFQAPLQ